MSYGCEMRRDEAPTQQRIDGMRLFILFLLWCGLLVFSWPVALLALVVFPFVWLLCLPVRLVGIVIGAVFAFLKALLYLPARILGHRSR